MSKQSKFSEEQILQMYQEYNDGVSSVQLAKKHHSNASTILSLFKNRNLIARSNKQNSRKYTINENYFENINTPEKAYWLGFIYADGYITSKRKTNSQNFGVSLAIKDKTHLNKLNECLNSNYPIKEYNQTSGYNLNTKYCRLFITSQKLVDDLKKQGVVENKTTILKEPKISKELIPHFIRGYVDGDGCISISNNEFKIKIIGTCAILDFIKQSINELGININNFYKRQEDQDVLSIDFGGNLQVLKFLNYIYKDSSVHLDRKFDRYKQLCSKYSVEPSRNTGC